VKDKLISKMAAAYSLQKMRKALSDLRDNVAAQKEAQKAQKEGQNLTSNFRENNANGNSNNEGNRINDKRTDAANSIDDGECAYLESHRIIQEFRMQTIFHSIPSCDFIAMLGEARQSFCQMNRKNLHLSLPKDSPFQI